MAPLQSDSDFQSRLPDRRDCHVRTKSLISQFVKGAHMFKPRPCVKHTLTFEERLAEAAKKFKEEATRQPSGSISRELLLRRARQAQTASRINDWLNSP